MYRVLSDEAEELRGYHTALVDHSRTVLTSWSNSCATTAPSSRD
jgi:hypothetical protein